MSMTDEQLRIAKNYVLTGGDNMDAIRKLVSNLFQSYDGYKSQVEETQKTLENLLLHAPENDIFDLYGACEMESDDWRDAKENARRTLQSLKGDKP
jgi:hypothetical protein